MKKIFEGVKLIALDMMGVVFNNGSLVKTGLYPLYSKKYSYQDVKGLYVDVRENVEGDRSLWEGLRESSPDTVRSKFLNSYQINSQFAMFKDWALNNSFGLGILSNMPKEWGEHFSRNLQLAQYCNPIVFSGQVGLKKPDLEIYNFFVKKSSFPAEEIIFIDDKLENLKPASEVGMRTIFFDRGASEGEFSPDMCITEFQELF